jgi:hypothetical protein
MWITFCICLISDRVLCLRVFLAPYSYKQGNSSNGGLPLVKTCPKVGHHVHAGRRWDLNWLIRCSVDLKPAYIAICHMCVLACGQSLLLHSDVCSAYYSRIVCSKAAPLVYVPNCDVELGTVAGAMFWPVSITCVSPSKVPFEVQPDEIISRLSTDLS